MTTPDLAAIERYLEDHHGSTISGLEPLRGGYWSSAYRYDVDTEPFVVRFARDARGFRKDQEAYRFTRPDLPIPEVLFIGEGLGYQTAISRRAPGRFLEDVGADEADLTSPMIDALLDGLRAAAGSDTGIDWFAPQSPGADSWQGWLRDALTDDPAAGFGGWRAKLAADPHLDALFTTTMDRVAELSESCPERRDLLHGDLLHQNVLVTEDASAVTAVFSWKHSVLGDFLYDVAWLTFWEPWHPGVAAVDVWTRTMGRLDADLLVDAGWRHHCYELHIGAQHLAWCAWTGNAEELAKVADHTNAVLQRGPR